VIWVFASVVVLAVALFATVNRYKVLDNQIKGLRSEDRVAALEEATKQLRGHLADTQRSIVKVDGRLVQLAKVTGHANAFNAEK
jgi:hypothetical protein